MPLPPTVRRRDLATMGLAAGLLSQPLSPLQAAAATRSAANTRGSLERRIRGFSPEESLRQFMRLFSGLAGVVCLTNEGIIHGQPVDDVARPLFGFRSALMIRTTEIEPNVFRTEQREAMHYADLETGAPLESWRSPYLGETLIPVGFVSPLNVYFFDITGSYARELPAQRSGRKFLDWRATDTEVWVTESRFNSFPSGITEEEFPRAYSGPLRKSVDILTYTASQREFADTRRNTVMSQVQMISDTPWPFWMMMGRRPGNVLWNGIGKKYASFAALPDRFREATEQVFPKFLADPWAFPEREFSTVAQLKRLKAAGRL